MAEQEPPAPGLVPGPATFGETLRREREIRGVSLKEIADSSKISKRFLEAIERNDFRNLPAPVFTRGFIRQYAQYLGLNADEMINHYMQFVQLYELEEERKSGPIPVPIPPQRLSTLRSRPIPRTRIDGNLVLFIVFVVALAGVGFWALRYHHNENLAPEKAAAKEADGPKPMPMKSETGALATESAAPLGALAPAATAGAAGEKDDKLHLTMELTSGSWIVLQADGHTVVSDDIRKGTKQTFDADREFHFKTIGNAGGVILTLNGVKVPPLGDEGKVRKDVTLDRAWLEKNGAAPRT